MSDSLAPRYFTAWTAPVLQVWDTYMKPLVEEGRLSEGEAQGEMIVVSAEVWNAVAKELEADPDIQDEFLMFAAKRAGENYCRLHDLVPAAMIEAAPDTSPNWTPPTR